jgi:hypothetical protein
MNQLPATTAFGNYRRVTGEFTEVRGANQGLFPGVGPVDVLRIILPRPSLQPVEQTRPEPAGARVRGERGGPPGCQRAGKGGGERGGVCHDVETNARATSMTSEEEERVCTVLRRGSRHKNERKARPLFPVVAVDSREVGLVVLLFLFPCSSSADFRSRLWPQKWMGEESRKLDCSD